MTLTVRAIAIEPAKTTRTVIVRCPYCQRRHTHGWPYGSDTIGGRLSHCLKAKDRADYRILPPLNYKNGDDAA